MAKRRLTLLLPPCAGVLALAALLPAQGAGADNDHLALDPGNLLVATSTYQTDPGIVAGVTQLPPGCSSTKGAPDPCSTAVTDGTYPTVFNNSSVDGSFGVTSEITLNELSPWGTLLKKIDLPNSSQPEVTSSSNQLVTSFSSKSELALNLSTHGKYVTFIGYNAPNATADVSNANTPGDPDPTSAVPGSYYRVVGQIDAKGSISYTETNAFNGDNGRAAVLNDTDNLIYAAGNAGNGASPEPAQVVTSAGAQLIVPSSLPESAQTPSSPTPLGSFNVLQLGFPADKSAKDNNYRGLTAYHHVVYYTKGSGSNGVDTVYFVDPTGQACPTTGVGLPETGASWPTTSTPVYDATAGGTITKKGVTTNNPGLEPTNMCILKGFPTSLASGATDASDYPFGLWFANPTTLYVADEGAGDNTYSSSTGTYTAAAASTTAGLQKWVLDSSTGQWNLAYTLQSGLNLGQPYTVAGYPTGLNSGAGGTGLPWAPATAGLRNLTGRVNPDGTVTLWAETSTVSGSGDQGADPNQLVSITDKLGATTAPATESFHTVVPAKNGVVVRGVSFTPGSVTHGFEGGHGHGDWFNHTRRES